MHIVFLESHPLIEETRNQVAVMRGPIIYCLESPDLPPHVDCDQVAIDVGSKWTSRWEENLLGGVNVLEGPLVVRASHEWADQLYRPREPHPGRRVQGTLIPYYAWANRGVSEMTVWIPMH